MPVLGRARPVRPQIYRGWVEFAAAPTNAPAGGPTAAGDALQPEATVAPNAGNPTATGASTGTVANVRVLAACPTAAGSATGATVRIGALAASPVAAGDATGTTAQTSADVYPRATTVATLAAVKTAETRYHRQPISTVDLGAPVGQPETLAPAACPTAAGSATGTTVQTSTPIFSARTFVVTAVDESVLARRRQATAQFVDLGAPVVQADVNAQAACPTAAGAANAATADLDAKPNTPVAAGSSDGQTVETGAFANAPAGVASATGTAHAASTRIRPNAAVGLAAGLASGSEAEIGAKPGSPTGAGTAGQATVLFGTQAPAGLASATGAANAPKIDIEVLAGAAVGGGDAFPVFGLTGNPTGPGQPITIYDPPATVSLEGGVGIIFRESEPVEV